MRPSSLTSSGFNCHSLMTTSYKPGRSGISIPLEAVPSIGVVWLHWTFPSHRDGWNKKLLHGVPIAFFR